VYEQIFLLPYHFATSLHERYAKKISGTVQIELGAATVFGWIAYTIFDNTLDNEGNPEHISVATLCLREVVDIYGRTMPPSGRALFTAIMDGIDRANAWERRNCFRPVVDLRTLPSYGDDSILAEKSLGHALGPIAILLQLGQNVTSTDTKALISFFKHYLIARQLNDDAHDWLADLKRGFLNSVSVEVLKRWHKKQPTVSAISLSPDFFATEETNLQRIFWNTTIVGVLKKIDKHCTQARRDLAKIHSLRTTDYFTNIIASLEHASATAKREREMTLEFLKTY
jgi:hypothetical protein